MSLQGFGLASERLIACLDVVDGSFQQRRSSGAEG